MNLRWSWDLHTRDLFRWVDPDRVGRHGARPGPAPRLGQRGPARRAGGGPGFLPFLDEVSSDLDRYLDRDRWFQGRADSPLRSVAYFSPEFGIAEALPQYSGGLGVLAGDHLKAASDLGVPLIGVGLFYRHGYFRQALNVRRLAAGALPQPRPLRHGPAPCRTACGSPSTSAGAPLHAQVWRADVGRIRLYLLDSRRRGERRRAARRHRPPLRRRHRAPPAPGDPARHRRRAGAAGPRHRHPGLPHQRGPRRVPRPRAHPRAHRRGPLVRRGHRGGAGGIGLHDPHARARRHRPVPPRAHGEVLHRLGRRRRHRHRRAAWPSATSRTTPSRPGSTWRSWACGSPARPTASPSCTAQ